MEPKDVHAVTVTMFVDNITKSYKDAGNLIPAVGEPIRNTILAANYVTLAVEMTMPLLRGWEIVNIEKVSATLNFVAAENKKSKYKSNNFRRVRQIKPNGL